MAADEEMIDANGALEVPNHQLPPPSTAPPTLPPPSSPPPGAKDSTWIDINYCNHEVCLYFVHFMKKICVLQVAESP